ncbi:MAG: hypothetical protein DCF32_00235 [Leptolyngbya sp.]|nr:MAG: hypothetical protein DCF32_00235 [Leptolyngbya sp.]
MSLQIKHLKLKITTPDGLFGVDIPFSNGLFVLHADNTSGKSTCLQSILYALGLEGMMGSSHDIPLPQVATDVLTYGDKDYSVLESEVLLEISNGSEYLTTRRQIKGEQSNQIITAWNGPVLSQSATPYASNNYFVRIPGGASREAGFHRLLANFVGWNLPTVPNYNEGETLLYMETLFPYMFVEQKRGWSSLRNRTPTHFRIKEVSRRAFEFLFDLDAQEIATQRTILNQQKEVIKSKWSSKISECSHIVQSINGIVDNIPLQPEANWPPSIQPRILVSREGNWISISQFTSDLEEHLRSLEAQDIPTVEDISEDAQNELQVKQDQLVIIDTNVKLKFEEIENQTSQITEIRSRISSLEEEVLKNRDLRKLSDLNAAQDLQTSTGVCPTCQQSITDSLIAPQEMNPPMTIDQNVEFIREQLRIFQAMLQSEERNFEIKNRELNSIKSRAIEVREDIRALKTTLTSQSNAPSYSAIEERVRLTEKVRHVRLIRDQVDVLLGSFSELSDQWREVQTGLSALPDGALSREDRSKLNDLENSFRQQLQEYGFSSINPSEIEISPDTYFPEYEGYDLQFDLSASDYIRVFWAYLLGLLEVSRNHQTNHLGVLILDEPRQQSARETSIEAFLRRASLSREFNQQVIVATSESVSVLEQYIGDIPHTYRRFDGVIISPMS